MCERKLTMTLPPKGRPRRSGQASATAAASQKIRWTEGECKHKRRGDVLRSLVIDWPHASEHFTPTYAPSLDA